MTTGSIQLSIVTPEKLAAAEQVDQVNVPGADGDIGVLADHAPLITTLRPGALSYEKGGEVIEMIVSGGYMEVTDNRVTVLAETAEFVNEIDEARAEASKTQAEELLAKGDLSEDEFIETQKKLFRAIARLEAKGTQTN